MEPNTVTRKSLLDAYRAAVDATEHGAPLTLRPASAAGMMLQLADGDPTLALRRCPTGDFWIEVRRYLVRIHDREAAVVALAPRRTAIR